MLELIIIVLIGLVAEVRHSKHGVPSIVLGVDRCEFCGMVITDLRFAAMYYDERSGRWLKFDDIGCMLYTLKSLGEYRGDRAIVFDYDTKRPINASDAWFVVGDPKLLPTPMGSGIAAFADKRRAEEFAAEVNGTVLDWDGLVEAFKRGEVKIAEELLPR